MEMEKNEVAKILKKKNKSYINSQIIVENSQLDEKLPVNKQGGATEDALL